MPLPCPSPRCRRWSPPSSCTCGCCTLLAGRTQGTARGYKEGLPHTPWYRGTRLAAAAAQGPCILATPLTSCCRGCKRCSIKSCHPISPATAEFCRLRIVAASCVELEQCYCVCRKESLCAGRNMVWWHSRITHPPPGAQSRRAACVRREAGGRQQLATPCALFLRRVPRGGTAAPAAAARHRVCRGGAGGRKVAAVQRAGGRGQHAAAFPPRPALGACECIADFGYVRGNAARNCRSADPLEGIRILRTTKCGLVKRFTDVAGASCGNSIDKPCRT